MFSSLKPKPETFHMKAAGLDEPVLVRRSPRARRISLSVNEAKRGAVLTVPRHATLDEAGRFLAQHFEWLQKRLAAIPAPVPFADGVVLPLRGEDHVVRLLPEIKRRGAVWIEEGASIAPFDLPNIHVSGAMEHAPRRLKDWLKREARSDLSARCTAHAAALQVRPKRITIRDQTSRWGSCSAGGVLSFSWRLILAPRDILDYLAAHEVAHLREMNHGPRFWEHVHDICPQTDRAKKWLRKNGAQLHRYGADPG